MGLIWTNISWAKERVKRLVCHIVPSTLIWPQSLVVYFFICIFLIILVHLDATSLFCEVFFVLSIVIGFNGLMSCCWSSYCWLLMLVPSQIRIGKRWFVKYVPFNLLRVPLHQCLFGQKAPSISCRSHRAEDAVILSQKITGDRSKWICIRWTRGKPWWTSRIHPWTVALPHQTNDPQTDGCCSDPVCCTTYMLSDQELFLALNVRGLRCGSWRISWSYMRTQLKNPFALWTTANLKWKPPQSF